MLLLLLLLLLLSPGGVIAALGALRSAKRSSGRKARQALGKGTNGVSTNGVTAFFLFLTRGTFWVLPLSYFYLPKSARAYFFPNLSKIITFAAALLVLTLFVRNQKAREGVAVRVSTLDQLKQTGGKDHCPETDPNP